MPPTPPLDTIARQRAAIAAGDTTAAALVDEACARAEAPDGEGGLVFLHHYGAAARQQAQHADAMRAAGVDLGPLAGMPVSIKDLFDVAGETTRAGSIIRQDAEPAPADAAIVRRLKGAGAILVGRTNMTEFAYSGIGINPHYGTPANPWDRENRRIPGGSSSGAAVSVADGMAIAGIGTDTGGSVRIPAALCGLAGFKPTARRVPQDGCFPLSFSLDSIGPLAASVDCCAVIDAVMAGEDPAPLPDIPAKGLRLGIAQSLVLDGLEEPVVAAFEVALTRLSAAGARLIDLLFAILADIPRLSTAGGLAAAEALALHRRDLEIRPQDFDHRVAARILNGANISGADYVDLLQARARYCREADALTAPFDAVLMPTNPRVAPRIADLEGDDAAFGEANLVMLRNTAAFNFLDRCATTLPIHRPGEAPVGLMVVGETLGDRRNLAVAKAIEAALAAH
ncbi:MAG: amidase [Rhodospirillaceae bacterium]|nr:amidase [Rhodospirillaceae bacterium]MDE0617176.1 amidase [Rhodospirillaceae bacterium]